jgi:hypothetical protein
MTNKLYCKMPSPCLNITHKCQPSNATRAQCHLRNIYNEQSQNFSCMTKTEN